MTTQNTPNRYQVLGINDEQTTCDCCGKKNLKKVVWIEDRETGDVLCFGSTCALQPVKGFGVDKEIKAALSDFANWQQGVWRMAHKQYKAEGGTTEPDGTGYGWKVTNLARYEEILAGVIASHPAPMRSKGV